MPYFLDCPGCHKRFQLPSDPAGKRIRCRACGAVVTAPAPESPPDDEDDSEPRPRRKGRPRRPANWCRVPVLLLLVGYFPLLAFLCLSAGSAAAWLLWQAVKHLRGDEDFDRLVGTAALLLGAFLGLTVLHVVWGLRALFHVPNEKDDLEFQLPKQWQRGLTDLVRRVADERGLPAPDVIRLHAADVAKVYEDRRGRTVLVIGGVAVAALSQRALAGIIAHELGHSGGGDTALSRVASRWHRVMAQLERQFWGRNWYRLNPLAWVIRLYHFVYVLFWYANMRQQEYAADRHEVEHVGKEKAAAALVLVTLLHEMEWAALGAVAEACVETNQPLEGIFAEQVRRIRVAGPSDWEAALRKARRAFTGWYDSHPCLADRLKALRVSPKKALRLAMDLSGTPATELFANWPVVEKFLTDRIMDIVRENYLARQEYEAIAQAIARQMNGRG
jgi:Zn-dependent protease with chaperone function